jgi:hypothetical protein
MGSRAPGDAAAQTLLVTARRREIKHAIRSPAGRRRQVTPLFCPFKGFFRMLPCRRRSLPVGPPGAAVK